MINIELIKLILAALLIICLLPMPYGYYILVRFISMVVFSYLAYASYQKENKPTPLVFTFSGLALLFQPFVKITLGRGIWNLVDIAVAAFLVIIFLSNRRNLRGK